MKKRFLEGFRKFVAIFVLVQMVLVLFPAPAVYASSEGTQSAPDTSFADPQFAEYPYSNDKPLRIEAENYSGAEIDFTRPKLIHPDSNIDVRCYTDESLDLHNEILSGEWLPIGEHIVTCKAMDGGVGRGEGIQFTIEIYDGPPVLKVKHSDIENPLKEYEHVEIGTKFINPWIATATDDVDDSNSEDDLKTVISVEVKDNSNEPVGSCKDITDNCQLQEMINTEKEGKFTITYTAKDGAQNYAEEEIIRTVHVVDEDPLDFIFIDPTPKDNHIQNFGTFTVRISENPVDSGENGKEVFEIKYCDLYIDGTEPPIEMFPPKGFTGQEEYKHHSALVEITQDQGTTKEYEYTVFCWNADKGTTSFTRKITIDLEAPDLSFVSPTPINGSIINEGVFEVRVEGSEELDRCQVSLNNGEIIPMTLDKTTGQWFSVLSGLSEGGYGYVVNCFDLAENSNNISRFLIVDFVNEPVVLTPVSSLVVSDFYTPVTEKDETAISSAIEKIEEDVLGEEGAVAETQAGNWWWIVALILAALLFANFHLAKRFSEMDIAKKILMVTPMVFGLVALVIHQSLIRGTEYSPWQDDIWLLIAVMVVAYYLFKGYTEKKEEKPKPSITKNSKNKKGKK